MLPHSMRQAEALSWLMRCTWCGRLKMLYSSPSIGRSRREARESGRSGGSRDAAKADRVEGLLAARGTISVQVLNEFGAVSLRKLRMPLPEVKEILGTVRAVCDVVPLTVETHDHG